MQHTRLDIPIRSPVASLTWEGDSLMDWSTGNRLISLDGKTDNFSVVWGYRFNAATSSPSGRHTAVYEKLGTKALLLDRGSFLRELNRSYYHAEVYEYPLVLFEHPDGRELIAHCPDEYNRIEIDEVATGKRLTDCADRKPQDFFHSRLAVSPGGGRLLSAGWAWHPFDSVCTWSIADALADPRVLDQVSTPEQVRRVEINAAIFVDANRILMSSGPDADDFSVAGTSPFGAACLGVFDLEQNAFETVASTKQTVGNMLWLGENRVVGFHEFPKVFDVDTGQVIFSWPDILSGKQDGSIIHHLEPLPPIAMDPARKRFAVAAPNQITVIGF